MTNLVFSADLKFWIILSLALWSVTSTKSLPRNTNTCRPFEMDRVECFVAGRKIAMGVIKKNGIIEAYGDDFECPSHLFQTYMNRLSPPGEHQLYFVREFLHGVYNPQLSYSVK